MRSVLVVAAEPFELKWIASRSGLRFTGVAGGAGPRLAGAVASSALAGGVRFDAVVSTGLCGALDPGLGIGDVFVGTEVNGRPVCVPATSSAFRSGRLLSVDRIVGRAAERRKLFESGYAAVEMEAAAVAESAERAGLPFYCIRAVSDGADEDFETDMNAARDSDGRIVVRKIVWQAVRRPGTVLPELLRLRRNADRAARALGAFIATCDF